MRECEWERVCKKVGVVMLDEKNKFYATKRGNFHVDVTVEFKQVGSGAVRCGDSCRLVLKRRVMIHGQRNDFQKEIAKRGQDEWDSLRSVCAMVCDSVHKHLGSKEPKCFHSLVSKTPSHSLPGGGMHPPRSGVRACSFAYLPVMEARHGYTV